jgi:hypothetical protein
MMARRRRPFLLHVQVSMPPVMKSSAASDWKLDFKVLLDASPSAAAVVQAPSGGCLGSTLHI